MPDISVGTWFRPWCEAFWFWRDNIKSQPKYQDDWKWQYYGAEGAD